MDANGHCVATLLPPPFCKLLATTITLGQSLQVGSAGQRAGGLGPHPLLSDPQGPQTQWAHNTSWPGVPSLTPISASLQPDLSDQTNCAW